MPKSISDDDRELAQKYRELRAAAKERSAKRRAEKDLAGEVQISAWVPKTLAKEIKLYLGFISKTPNVALCQASQKKPDGSLDWKIVAAIVEGKINISLKK